MRDGERHAAKVAWMGNQTGDTVAFLHSDIPPFRHLNLTPSLSLTLTNTPIPTIKKSISEWQDIGMESGSLIAHVE